MLICVREDSQIDAGSSTDDGDWFDPGLAARACRMSLIEQQNKSEIAEALGISRFRVARLINEARTRGMVRIDIIAPEDSTTGLEAELTERYGLRAARVAATGPTPDRTLREVGRLAAALALGRLRPGDLLGLGWGRTVGAVVPFLNADGPIDVIQLAGGFPGVDRDFNGTQVVIDTAAQTHGAAHLLHAPALLQTAEARAALLDEPTVRATSRLYDNLSVTITGLGALHPSATSALYRGSVLSDELKSELRRSGAIGDACCHFIDASGSLIESLEDRIVGVTATQILAADLRISAAFGSDKVPAIRAALRSGLLNAIVLDTTTATLLLR
jgi:DNA-binding transcriptional regulator LsrR (DeoR family)